MTDAHAPSHDPTAHDGHAAGHDGHGDGHGEDELGPFDLLIWGVGLLGVAIGLLVCFCFASATGVF
jgi:hypothetical protein